MITTRLSIVFSSYPIYTAVPIQQEPSAVSKALYIETAGQLHGKERRLFMARVVIMLGRGGQRWAENELGWNRGTIRRGLQELNQANLSISQISKKEPCVADPLVNLERDIRAIIKEHCYADPEFWRCGKKIPFSVNHLINLLISEKGYSRQQLPSAETIRRKIIKMGYRLR